MQLVFPADVDECVDAGACGAARCQNLPGSYSCVCDEGYVFSSQEKGCQGTYLRPRGTHRHTQGAMLQGALCRVPPEGLSTCTRVAWPLPHHTRGVAPASPHTREVAPSSPHTRRGPFLTTHAVWPLPHHTRSVAPAAPYTQRGPFLTCTHMACLTCTHVACLTCTRDVAPASPAHTWPLPPLHAHEVARLTCTHVACLTCTHVTPASPAHMWPCPPREHMQSPLPPLHTRRPRLPCAHMKWPRLAIRAMWPLPPLHACDIAPASRATGPSPETQGGGRQGPGSWAAAFSPAPSAPGPAVSRGPDSHTASHCLPAWGPWLPLHEEGDGWSQPASPTPRPSRLPDPGHCPGHKPTPEP